jgi:hypothetical protein
MPVAFPSVEFFRGLQQEMKRESERFRRLGYFDTRIGIRVSNGDERSYVLTFEVFELADVREVASLEGEQTDFVLEGSVDAWREMLDNIRSHGKADGDHSINTLTHFGEKIRVVYDDPDGHDKLYRFDESVQEFFDLVAKLDFDYPDSRARSAASA